VVGSGDETDDGMTRYKTPRLAAVLTAAALACGLHPFAASAEGYQMTEADMKLSCKQLSGRIQVRLLQARDYGEQQQSSLFSRSLQSAFSNTVGTSSKGLDPDGRHTRDLQMIAAYNHRLAEKGCKSYDLDKELRNRNPHELPAATVPARKPKSKR
jgi:hypothetical protein